MNLGKVQFLEGSGYSPYRRSYPAMIKIGNTWIWDCRSGMRHVLYGNSQLPRCFIGGECEFLSPNKPVYKTTEVGTVGELSTQESKPMNEKFEAGDTARHPSGCCSARPGVDYIVSLFDSGAAGIGSSLDNRCSCTGDWILVLKKGAQMADTDGIPKKLSIMESVFADADDKLLIKAGLFEKGELTETGKKALAIINLKANKAALVELATTLLADSEPVK